MNHLKEYLKAFTQKEKDKSILSSLTKESFKRISESFQPKRRKTKVYSPPHLTNHLKEYLKAFNQNKRDKANGYSPPPPTMISHIPSFELPTGLLVLIVTINNSSATC
jgi:hypothetical protein